MEKLTSLQKCVNDAQHEPRVMSGVQIPMATATIRVHQSVLEKVEPILQNHGVSLSAYLRKCCENLVKDYADAQG